MYKANYTAIDTSKVRDMRIIPDYSRYAADSEGNLYSLNYKNSGKVVMLRPCVRDGYLQTMLLGDDGRYHTKKVHRLVCSAFYGKSNLEINHKDGNKLNNHLENLEYCTHSENVQHAFDNGLTRALCGEDNPTHKLTDAEVAEIRAFVSDAKAKGIRYYGRAELAAKYGVSSAYIKDLVSRRRNIRS